MLKSMTKGACALAAALTLTGTAALAETHSIEIGDGAYLPAITYVQSGDKLMFENPTNEDQIVNGPNNSWTTGVIPPGGSYIHNISDGPSEAMSFSGVTSDGYEMFGEWSFEAAPLEQSN